MIPVNTQRFVLDDVVKAIDNYSAYLKLTTNIAIENPFVVTTDSPIPIIHYSNVDAIKASTATTVIIDMITEGFNISGIFYQYPKNKKYIFFSAGRWNTNQIDFGFEYKILHWNYFLYDYVKRGISYNLIDFFQEKEHELTAEKKFAFSALIGNRRPWRDQLVSSLQKNIKFDNFVLNYAGTELGQSSRQLDIKYDFSNYDSYKAIHQFYSISSSIPIELYNKSKVLLVAETSCESHDEFFITEKTVKALLSGVPFVLCGSYRFLENLQAMGFQTYNEIWDESYDQISNVDERILALIATLNSIDALDWNTAIVDKCRQIAYHNKSLLLNMNSIMKKELEVIVETFGNYQI